MILLKQNSLDPEVIVGYADNYYEFLLKMKEDISISHRL